MIGSPSCCCFGDTADAADVDWVRVVMDNGDDSESIDIREQSDDEDGSCGSLCCEVPLLLLLGDALLQLMVVMVESDLGLDATRVMLMQRIASDAAAPPLIIDDSILLLAMFIYLECHLIGMAANKRLVATNNSLQCVSMLCESEVDFGVWR